MCRRCRSVDPRYVDRPPVPDNHQLFIGLAGSVRAWDVRGGRSDPDCSSNGAVAMSHMDLVIDLVFFFLEQCVCACADAMLGTCNRK